MDRLEPREHMLPSSYRPQATGLDTHRLRRGLSGLLLLKNSRRRPLTEQSAVCRAVCVGLTQARSSHPADDDT